MTGAGAPNRPSRRELAGRLSILKRAVVAVAVVCFAGVGTAVAVQGSTGNTQTARSGGSQQQETASDRSDFWADPSEGASGLDGGSAEAPVAGSHAS